MAPVDPGALPPVVGRRHLRRERLQQRVPERRDLPLVEAHVRRAPHPTGATTPRLLANPLQRVVAIHPIVHPRREPLTLGAETAATILRHHRVPAAREVHAEARESIRRCLVRRATQNHWRGRHAAGKYTSRGEVDAVAHGHLLIAQDADTGHRRRPGVDVDCRSAMVGDIGLRNSGGAQGRHE